MGQAPPFARRVGNDGDAGLGGPQLNRQALGRDIRRTGVADPLPFNPLFAILGQRSSCVFARVTRYPALVENRNGR